VGGVGCLGGQRGGGGADFISESRRGKRKKGIAKKKGENDQDQEP